MGLHRGSNMPIKGNLDQRQASRISHYIPFLWIQNDLHSAVDLFSCECRRSQSHQTIEVSLVLTGKINSKNASITSTQISIISVHNSAILVLAVCTDRVLAVYTSCIGYKHWEGMAKYHVLYIPLCYKCINCKCLVISCWASHPEHFLATNLAFLAVGPTSWDSFLLIFRSRGSKKGSDDYKKR